MRLGSPITTCPKCKIAIKNNHINEWELISDLQKLHYFFSLLYTSLAFSLPIIFIIIFLLSKSGYEKYFWVNEKPADILFLILGLTVFVVFIFQTSSFVKAIKRSKDRMKDQEYRAYLRSYGIIDALDKISNCEYCDTEVELTLTERIQHKFICPECNKTNFK